MTSALDAPWFYWAVGVAIGFPICLILLTELHSALRRRGSILARPVHLVRNYILPLGALLILLVGAMQISGETTPVRVVATVFGFVVLVLLLSGTNATLFAGGPGRKLAPSDSVDLSRGGAVRVDCGGRWPDPRLYLGRTYRRAVHRARRVVDRARADPAELRRANHLGPARPLRAAVSARRLDRNADGKRPRGRSQLARHTYRHRQRAACHAQLGTGCRILHELLPAARRSLPQCDHGVRGRRPARRRPRDVEPGRGRAATIAARRGAVDRAGGRARSTRH